MTNSRLLKSLFLVTFLCVPSYSDAQEQMPNSVNMYGTTGLIDMPTAGAQPDAEFTTTLSNFSSIAKVTLSFQITPRLSGSFRYSRIGDYHKATNPKFLETADRLYDRSFDLQYLLLKEKQYQPAVAVGLRDFLGTGVFSSEYIVATKNLGPKFRVTAGIGWGRLNGDTTGRTVTRTATGGNLDVENWFSGSAGYFGGIEWQTPIDRFTVKAEYSSDKYYTHIDNPNRPQSMFERNSPINVGLEYRNKKGTSYGLYYLYGSEVGFRITSTLNPFRPPVKGSYETAPLPIKRREYADPDTAWLDDPEVYQTAIRYLNKGLKKEGMRVEALHLQGTRAELRLRNNRYDATPQAIGRAARILSSVMPASVEEFAITPVVQGLPTTTVVLNRTDLENYENAGDGTNLIYNSAKLQWPDKLPKTAEFAKGLYPKFNWAITPYAVIGLFDPTEPLRVSGGIRLKAKYNVTPNLSFSGAVSKRLVGNLSQGIPVQSQLPHVRSETSTYIREGDLAIEYLTADYLFRPMNNIYGRVSAGMLERMFGGVSAELLWKPVNRKWGIGAEINYVQQRDFDSRFTFQDYNVVTGHISGYYDFQNGFSAQLDVGRYLAGDYGATLSIDRTFANNWSVGAYATRTDVPFATFGEGSFDKGIRLTIPLSWAVGKPSQKMLSTTIQSLSRDGGARLHVNNRLYPMVKKYHRPQLEKQWGKFWR